MPPKPGLGRGLDALISVGKGSKEAGNVTLRLDQISPNPRQPRGEIDQGDLQELADSIRLHGILQPLIVTASEELDSYVLIAGERRLKAARLAGLERVPVIVREASEQERLELALIENLQREDLNPLEAAQAYQHLVDDFGLSHEEIASRVAKSRAAVTNTLRLLRLPEEVRHTLSEGQISEGHARALLSLSTPQSQLAALQTVLAQELNVRQTEALVRKLVGERPAKTSQPAPDPEISALQIQLEQKLGTRVQLHQSGGKGNIRIFYYSEEELNTLVDRLLDSSWH